MLEAQNERQQTQYPVLCRFPSYSGVYIEVDHQSRPQHQHFGTDLTVEFGQVSVRLDTADSNRSPGFKGLISPDFEGVQALY